MDFRGIQRKFLKMDGYMELFMSLHQKLTDSTQPFEVSHEKQRDCHKKHPMYEEVGKLGYMEWRVGHAFHS